MLRLDFSVSDLNLPVNREKTRRASISDVQGWTSSPTDISRHHTRRWASIHLRTSSRLARRSVFWRTRCAG